MKWVAVAIVLVALSACSHRSVVDDSIGKLNDTKRFATSARAAQTIADISTRLRAEGAACRKAQRRAPQCAVLLQAAAYSAVTAYTLADCTAPGVYDGRNAMLRYLRAIDKFMDGAAQPSVPNLVTC